MGQRGREHTASEFINAHRWRVEPVEAAERIAEREARLAADTRSPAELLLGDPPRSRSALARVKAQRPTSAPGALRG
jgi:hypothetical protein